MTLDEIKRSADLTNGGVLRDVYVSPEQARELNRDGYRVAGRNVYVPRYVGERPLVDPKSTRSTCDDDFDWEGAILAKQCLDGL